MMISEQDRRRVEKLLGILTSDFDGERATAGQMIARIAKEYKLTVPELCKAIGPQPSSTNNHSKPQAPPQDNPMGSGLVDAMNEAQDIPGFLNQWESDFCASITAKYAYDEDLSEKQRGVATRIAHRLERRKRNGW